MLACPARCFNAQQVKLAPEGFAILYVSILRIPLLINSGGPCVASGRHAAGDKDADIS